MQGKPQESPFSKRFQREQKRTAILSEAARLFNIYGARATRLSDVAECLELNKTSLYYYVKSKDDLVFETYQATCNALDELLQQAAEAGGDGADRLTRFIRAYFSAWHEILQGQRPHLAILTEIRALKPAHRKRIAKHYSAMYHRVKDFISRGVDDGTLAPCNETDAALAVFGLLQLTVLWLPQYDQSAFNRAADSFIDIVMNGIAAVELDPGPEPAAIESDRQMAVEEGQGGPRPAEFCRVASAFFNRKGFKGTSLDDIAEELDLTKGAFYYHVDDKDDLLRRCFERSLDLMSTLQQRAAALDANGLQRLWACVRHLFAVQTGGDGPLIRFNLIPSLAPGHRPDILQGLERVSGRFGAMIEGGIVDGSLRPVDPFIAEQVLMSAVDLAAELPWMREIGDGEGACRSYFRFFFTGLRNTAD